MLHRLLLRHAHQLRALTLITPKSPLNPFQNPKPSSNFFYSFNSRHFSSNNDRGDGKDTSEVWKLSQETEDDVFDGIDVGEKLRGSDDWLTAADSGFGKTDGGDILKEIDGGNEVSKSETWPSVGGEYAKPELGKAWRLEEEKVDDVFGIGVEERVQMREDEYNGYGVGVVDKKEEILKNSEEEKELQEEEKKLTEVLKGPNRAFGDLIAASGITDEMLDSLLALKDLGGIPGLPPLREIEDLRYEKNTRKSSRAEMERLKQEEDAKARVRQVDNKGRAYGTGRRKCSIARVWIQPGEGKFVVNDKEFDVYFPMLDQRAALLRPFSETKTLGQWDISCTVKGGGISGQVGAVQLGISRALQNWEPNLRPPLRAVGFLTRDARVVERKKPGKAKARKSFQWVKR